jgi:heat shock protein HslJ
MSEKPGRLRGGATMLAFGLVVAMLVIACGGSATPSPSSPSSSGGGSLNGTWQLTSYTSPGGTQAEVPIALTPNITFAGDAARGNAGCNTYDAIAIVSGNTVHFDNVTSTKVACPPPGSTVETAFLQGLSLASEWKVEGDTLTMSAPRGQPPVLVFKRAA